MRSSSALKPAARARAAVVLLAVLLAGLAAAAASASPSASGAAKSTLIVLEEDIAPTLDPDGPNSAHPQTQEIEDNVLEPLVSYPLSGPKNGILIPNYRVNPLQFQPRLATSYSRKGLVWTFKLRKNVKSCAGNTFTADDVVYTFAHAKAVSSAAPVSWFLGNIAGIFPLDPVLPKATAADKKLKGEVTKIDDYTVQFKQLQPAELFPRVLTILGMQIYDSKEFKKHATASDPWSNNWLASQGLAGFGPYCVSSWTKGSEMRLTANPNYYRGQPKYTNITIRKVPQIANRVAAIKNGAADLMYPLTPVVIKDLEKSSNVQVLQWLNNNAVSVGMNYALDPWKKGKSGDLLRKAVAYAMPYDEIIKEDYKGDARRWYGLIQSEYYGFKPFKQYHTDLAKAKRLVAQAGYPNGKGLDKFSSGLQLYYTVERATVIEPVANRIRTALAKIGIPISLRPISIAEIANRELTKYDLPMWIRDQLQPIGTDAGYSTQLFYLSKAQGGLLPSTGYDSASVFKDFQTSQQTTGATRLKALHHLQQTMMSDLPMVPILESSSAFSVRKGLGPIEGRANNTITYWYFK
jgi:peptide/nickel transport system substrate-binding protein